MSQRRKNQLRPLTVVYSANPHTGASVPMIGYRIAAGIAELTDARFVFHARHRKDLTGWFPEDRVVYAGSRRLAEGLRRLATRFFDEKWAAISIVEFLDYLVFDIDSYRKARKIVRKERVDFALRLTPTSPRYASALAYLPVPVFTGPHSGGLAWPPAFSHLRKREKNFDSARSLGDMTHKIYRDWGHYAGIFWSSELREVAVDPAYHDKVIPLAVSAVDKLGEPSPHAGDATRLLFVGRLVPAKVPDIVLRALAQMPPNVHLTIVGDGPERPSLEKLAAALGVQDRCEFVGYKPHSEMGKYYAEAGVFVFPSVRESGGLVVLEAMSHGLPCLVANCGGPSSFTRDTGIQLPVDSPQGLEDELVRTLTRLLEDPAEGQRVGKASRAAVRDEYIWSRKADLLIDAACERVGIELATPDATAQSGMD